MSAYGHQDLRAGPNVGFHNVDKHKASMKNKMRAKSVRPSNLNGLIEILKNPINLLMVFVPAGILAGKGPWLDGNPNKEMIVFWLNFVAMLPLANLLGDATEELAANLKNDTLSGLLNATFGNAVEIIMSLNFIISYQYDVLKASMVGSILSNMLLVLGMSFFFGGIQRSKQTVREKDEKTRALVTKEVSTMKDKEQNFNVVGALVNNTLLLVATFMLSLVTVFVLYMRQGEHKLPPKMAEYEIEMSRYSSVLIIVAYIAFLVFQLFTHAETLADEGGEEDHETPALDLKASLALLVAVTLVVAFSSELLSDSLHEALEGSGLGEEFMGVILLPIIGNACEHVSAIRFAIDDRAGLSVGIAVGSSVQIALFAIPFTVLAGWIIHPEDTHCNMDLNFGMLHVTVLFTSVIIVLSLIMDGKSNWLGGYLLMTAYLIAAGLYWFVEEAAADKERCGGAR